MKSASSATICILQLFVCSRAVYGEGFLKHDPNAIQRGTVDTDAAFKQAMASVMGCTAARGSNSQHLLTRVEQAVLPMWRVLPKSGQGRVEWKMLRYLTHRYFLQQSSLLIRGLEPVRQVNDSQPGVAEILDKHAPSIMETVLEGKRSSSGFTFEDAVAMIATMEQLIFESEGALLEKAYNLYFDWQPMRFNNLYLNRLTKQQLLEILALYTLLWMLGGDSATIEMVTTERLKVEAAIPHWSSIVDMIKGLVAGMEFSRQRHPKPGYGQLVMTQTFSVEDAHEVVGALSKTFASYWESECQAIKASLVSMDYSGTGRVKLSDFYGANVDGEMRFAESEAYLREHGVLDESSAWKGKQLVIPNYLHGASNCIVTSEHYFVCCVNECEEVLNEIESAVGSPLAAPEEIFRTIASITTFDDEPTKLTATFKHQLERIATTHAGKIPLHGRLFAQWLHYVFPRECPFPHKTRSIATFSPLDHGTYFASPEEVMNHASTRNRTTFEGSGLEEAQLMSQWSEEEELLADYSSVVRAPWQNLHLALVGVFVSFVAAFRFKKTSSSKPSDQMSHDFQCHTKAHFV